MSKVLQEAYDLRSQKVNKIEVIKELKTPMQLYAQLKEVCANGVENLAEEDSAFFLKCFGLFLKKDNTFMLRVRIPGGQLSALQSKVLGVIARTYGEDYIDITTRQQVEIRYVKLENIPKLLEALEEVGLSTFQTGVDNFRNIVTSAFDGLGKEHIIEVKPLIDKLQSLFFKQEDWIGTLPRKFNTGILGTKVNDCNIYGHDCSFIVAKRDEVLGFNLYLGGRVGCQAQDSGLFVKHEDVIPTFLAIVELFKKYGFRDNRNKNRLHFLLEAVGMEAFISSIKEYSGIHYETSGELLAIHEYRLDESGMYDLGDGQKALHFSIPSGVFSGSNLEKAGMLAQEYGGIIRLSVEQSFYIIGDSKALHAMKYSELYKSYKEFHTTYFNHQIACAGIATCSFGVIPNKPDAIEMAHFLEKEVPIKGAKVRMYWSACVKGCGIHGVADIGFEGCKAKDEDGNNCYGVHIFLGGKATKEAKEARVLYKSVPLKKAKYLVADLMRMYKSERLKNESFEAYDTRVLASLSVAEVVQKVEAFVRSRRYYK